MTCSNRIRDFLDDLGGCDAADFRETYFLKARRNLYLELTDVITAETSMLDAAGVDAADRQMYQRIINDRNGRRDGGRRFRREE